MCCSVKDSSGGMVVSYRKRQKLVWINNITALSGKIRLALVGQIRVRDPEICDKRMAYDTHYESNISKYKKT